MKKRQIFKNLTNSLNLHRVNETLNKFIEENNITTKEDLFKHNPKDLSSFFNFDCCDIKKILNQCKRKYGHRTRDFLYQIIKLSLRSKDAKDCNNC